jgi:hypothetical protein
VSGGLEKSRYPAVGHGQPVPAPAPASRGCGGAGWGRALPLGGVGVPDGDEGVAEEAAGRGALGGVAAEAERAEVVQVRRELRRQRGRGRVLGHVP